MGNVTGSCTYDYSPTERYQHPEWGSQCGRTTFAGFETVSTPVRQTDGSVKIVEDLRERDQPDPWCPLHGGTADPNEPVEIHDAEPSDVPPKEVTE